MCVYLFIVGFFRLVLLLLLVLLHLRLAFLVLTILLDNFGVTILSRFSFFFFSKTKI